ncbi:MAG: hypothetical protein ACM3QS_08150 [Bacteroidota bacterium]
MAGNSHQQGWIYGLPGFEKQGGLPVDVVDFHPPRPGDREMTFTLFADQRLKPTLRWQSVSWRKIPKFSLVVREHIWSESHNEYQLANAEILSVRPFRELPDTETIVVGFESISVQTALPGNPGPPPGAPQVRAAGKGTGWIFGTSAEWQEGIPLSVLDFIPPHFNGELAVHCDRLPPEIHREAWSKRRLPALSLVLPDRAQRQYVEYKLWGVRSFKMLGEQYLLLESDWIECLTG